MVKTAFFVVSLSLAILALFGATCYLMSTVNPPLLIVDGEPKEPSKLGDNLASFYLRNMEPTDVFDYGIEKTIYNSSVTHSSPSPVVHHRANFSNYIPTVKIKNPHLVKVYPPIWPPKTTSSFLTSKETKPLRTTKVSAIKPKENTTDSAKVESPIHRRSINVIEKNIDKNTGAVILKILDNDGKSRIEIKLNPNDVFEKKKSRHNRSFLKTDPTLTNIIEMFNTEIRILPNDTVIINSNNDTRETIDFRTNIYNMDQKYTIHNETVYLSNILYPIENSTADFDEENKIVKAMKIEKHNKTVTNKLVDLTDLENTTRKEMMVVPSTKATTTDVFGLKVMFDNVTRSFTEKYNDPVLRNKTK